MCLTEYDEAKTMNAFKEEGREEGREEGADLLASLLKKLSPGTKEFNDALNATGEERKELYKAYGLLSNI